MIAQPRWDTPKTSWSWGALLFVASPLATSTACSTSSTAQKKVRAEDQYSPGGRPGTRPNRASIVYSNLARRAFPGIPIVLGGIEASLRRIAHFDY